jgi:hypothetical protein
LGKKFFDALQNGLKLSLFTSPLAYVEIGAVNAWRSVGGFKISNIPMNKHEFDEVFSALQQSNVVKDKSHRKAIEFPFDFPLSHWLAMPISKQSVEKEISESLLNDALLLARKFIGENKSA